MTRREAFFDFRHIFSMFIERFIKINGKGGKEIIGEYFLKVYTHLLIRREREKERGGERERAYQIVDFAVPTDLTVKIKENEKRDEY